MVSDDDFSKEMTLTNLRLEQHKCLHQSCGLAIGRHIDVCAAWYSLSLN